MQSIGTPFEVHDPTRLDDSLDDVSELASERTPGHETAATQGHIAPEQPAHHLPETPT
jgi:hypothetical protein